MMFGIIPITFRFRGKLRRLAQIYQCFRDNPGKGLHPAQVSRQTGLSLAEANARLEATPELFVRLPTRKDGLRRYRLTSAATAQSPEEIEQFLRGAARRETLILYAIGTMVFLILLIVVIIIAPSL